MAPAEQCLVTGKKHALWAILALPSLTASASELAYTFLDFARPKSTVDATGVQTPVPGQTVRVNALEGDGIAVAGSLAVGQRFYLGGSYRSSIVDVTGVITSPLVTVTVADTFDLVQTNLAFGYVHEIGDELDLIAEISYDSSNYDFGSFAGENFDLDDSGAGGRIGLRWNPTTPVEIYAFARYSPVAKPVLSERTYDTGSSASAGVRWYFFENLGVGIEFDSGDIDTTTISMRFSFGNLPW
jgi:hypothetical protein